MLMAALSYRSLCASKSSLKAAMTSAASSAKPERSSKFAKRTFSKGAKYSLSFDWNL